MAVFRTDASVAIGGGHVMRCITLANALVDHGWRCGFARRCDMLTQMPIPEGADFDLLAFDTDDDESDALRRRWPGGADIMVVDHYGLDTAFEQNCRGWAECILAIDDLADRSHDADFLLDQTCNRMAEDYEGLVPPRCRLLLGADYALLRPEFAALRDQALVRRRDSQPVQRILISVGSSDAANYTAVALDAVARSGLDVAVDVVLGSGAPHIAQIRMQCDELPLAIHLHVNIGAAEMASLIMRADIAISAGGIASWERCCLGLPTLVVLTAENQRFLIANLESMSAITFLGDAPAVDIDCISAALQRLAEDSTSRRNMGLKASEICDGYGVKRVVQALNIGIG